MKAQAEYRQGLDFLNSQQPIVSNNPLHTQTNNTGNPAIQTQNNPRDRYPNRIGAPAIQTQNNPHDGNPHRVGARALPTLNSPTRNAASWVNPWYPMQPNVGATDKSLSPELEKFFWPDGTCAFQYPAEVLAKTRAAKFGYVYCHYSTKKTKEGKITRRSYCLGVYKCPIAGCTWVEKPQQPLSKHIGARSPPCKYRCPVHSSEVPLLIPCTGGDARKHKGFRSNPPCLIETHIFAKGSSDDEVFIEHFGIHNHPRPPVSKKSKIRKTLKLV